MAIIFFKEFKLKKQKELLQKIYELRYYLIRFFEDLKITKDSSELPAWIECKNLMIKLKIDVDHPKIVNFYYNKLKKYKIENGIL